MMMMMMLDGDDDNNRRKEIKGKARSSKGRTAQQT